ncbi:T9SS type A sorting domain-containing protein [Roseivirga sp. BDSF3-8]|uniref:T9SS type A sorting domain-containing protein n=1 Tax=Roseivirga sp. BDSF3-8 TaxID=3241598 RepID=UPI003531A6B7
MMAKISSGRVFLPILFILLTIQSVFSQERITEMYGEPNIPPPLHARNFKVFNDLLFFSAYTRYEGMELYVSDGTKENTSLLKDIRPGNSRILNIDALRQFENSVELDGKLYFLADDDQYGQQVWVTTGNPEETYRVTSIPGLNAHGLSSAGGYIYFVDYRKDHVNVFKTSGSDEGVLVKGSIPYASEEDFYSQYNYEFDYEQFATDDKFYFAINPSLSDLASLWVSDGTTTGTKEIANSLLGTGFLRGHKLSPYSSLKNELFFITNSPSLFTAGTSIGLAKVDQATGNLVPVKGLIAEGRNVDYASSIVVNNKIYVSLFEADTRTLEIWESDGSADGTLQIYQTTHSQPYVPSNLATDGSKLFFTANNSTGSTVLKSIDLADLSIKQYKELNDPVVMPNKYTIEHIYDIEYLEGQKFLVHRVWPSSEANLWYCDMANEQYTLVPHFANMLSHAYYKGRIYSSAKGEDQIFTVHRTDSSFLEIELFKNIEDTKGLIYAKGNNLGDNAIYSLHSSGEGRELYMAGEDQISLVKDINPGASSSDPFGNSSNQYAVIGGVAYFTATSEGYKPELWRTDGTPAGTTVVQDFYEGTGHFEFKGYQAMNEELYLVLDKNHLYSLIKYDGAKFDTIKEFGTDEYGINVYARELIAGDNRLYFKSFTKFEYYIGTSDGTSEGTTFLKGYKDIGEYAIVGDSLFFSAASDVDKDMELWVTDGTVEGTAQLSDIVNGYSSSPSNFMPAGDKLYFSAYTKELGRELYVSDGTPVGTKLVADINEGEHHSFILNESETDYALLNGKLYFPATNKENGSELWCTDGTPENTYMVKDIMPMGEGSLPHQFVVDGDKIYFVARGINGQELWVTDGTSENTIEVADIYPGEDSSWPEGLVATDGRLFFVAESPEFGRQVYIYGKEPEVTGIGNNPVAQLVMVFPNPTSQRLFIDAKNQISELRVFDTSGKNYAVISVNKSIDVSHLPAGIYILTGKVKNELFQVRFIKQ